MAIGHTATETERKLRRERETQVEGTLLRRRDPLSRMKTNLVVECRLSKLASLPFSATFTNVGVHFGSSNRPQLCWQRE